jgi:hypothetical protein
MPQVRPLYLLTDVKFWVYTVMLLANLLAVTGTSDVCSSDVCPAHV